MSDTPVRRTYWVQIGIALAAGFVLAAGSCFGVLVSSAHPGSLAKFFVVGFFAGVVTVVFAAIWLLVETIKSILRG